MVENLHTDLLATFETYVIPVSEGGLPSETPRNIVGIFVGDAVSVNILAAEPLLLAEAVVKAILALKWLKILVKTCQSEVVIKVLIEVVKR